MGITVPGTASRVSWADRRSARDMLMCLAERPGGSIAITPCSANGTKNTFVCDLNNTKCRDPTQTFSLGGSSALVLRPVQVSALLAAVNNATASSTNTSATATGSANATGIASGLDGVDTVRSDAKYTSGDMAGLGVGLLIPMLIASFIAFRLWKQERARHPKLMYPLPDEDTFDLKPPPSNYFSPHPAVRSISSRDGYPAGKDSYDLASFRTATPTQDRSTPPHMHTFAERYQAMNKAIGGNLHEQSSFELDGQPVGSAFRFTTHGKPGEKERKESLTATTIDLGNRTTTTNKPSRDRDRERTQ